LRLYSSLELALSLVCGVSLNSVFVHTAFRASLAEVLGRHLEGLLRRSYLHGFVCSFFRVRNLQERGDPTEVGLALRHAGGHPLLFFYRW
jgi:hypothetical protein